VIAAIEDLRRAVSAIVSGRAARLALVDVGRE